MKKVLYTATVDSHIKNFHLPYLKYFKNHGYIVHVATNSNEPILYCDQKFNIPFDRKPLKFSNIKAIFKLRKIIKQEKYDLIVTNTPMGSVVTRLANKNRSRLIYIAHGFHFSSKSSKINWALFYPIEKYLMKYTDTLITINKEDYELAKKKFNTRVEYMPSLGLDTKKLDKKININEKIKLRKKLGINITDFVMIYTGELNNNKNQLFLIKCMPYLNKYNIHLLLVGDGKNKNKLEKYIIKNEIKNIHLLGYRDDVARLLQISDLLVSSSKREGLPFNVMEGMYEGLPILVSDARGNRDLVNNNGFIYKDEKDFIKKVELFYSDQLDIKKMKYNSELESQKYLIDQTLPLFDNIVNKLRVLHVLASNKFSGAENVVYSIIKSFNDIDMAYTSPDGAISSSLNDVNYYPLKRLSYGQIKRVVKRYKPDIIDAHDYKASLLCSLLHKKFKLISHIHKTDPSVKRISVKSILYYIQSRKFDKVIGVSNAVYDNALFKKRIKDKYVTIYNCVDKKDILDKSQEYKWSKKYDLFFLGRFVYAKDPLKFIEIVKASGKKGVMIGDGPLLDVCLKKIHEENIDIELLGFLPNPFPIIKNCKMGIMPSTYEGLSLVSIECSILDKPILNSGCPGLSEIFDKHPELICDTVDDYIEKINDDINPDLSNIVIKFTNKDNWHNEYKKIYRK